MGRLEGLEVVRSAIHGYGIVARRPFITGEVVCFGDGVLWHDEEDFDDTYALILSTADVANGFAEQPGDPKPLFWDLADQTRWINHSCSPNSVVTARWHPGEDFVSAWWSALRDIVPGEEITYDYAFSAQVAEACFCGTDKCRGVIVDPEEVHLLAPELRRLLRDVTLRAG